MNIAAHMGVAAPVGMTVVEVYTGKIEDYDGSCGVLYTEDDLSKNEYYYLKYLLLRRRIELIHPGWNDEDLNEFVVYMNMRENDRRCRGRLPFGFIRRKGVIIEETHKIELARWIIELRDGGMSYRGIKNEIDVELSIGTIQTICANRDRYEKKMRSRYE